LIRQLRPDDVAGTEFAHLLWLAIEVDNAELGRITRDELPKLTILGAGRVPRNGPDDCGIDRPRE